MLRLCRCEEVGALLIALTGAPRSSLAVHSDIVLDVGVAREACPLGLAPTASTTAMLAMGDALAVALIGRKRLKPEEFALYHPAGALGRRLLKVADVMRTGKANPIVGTGTRVKEVLLVTRAGRAPRRSWIRRGNSPASSPTATSAGPSRRAATSPRAPSATS